VLADVIETVCFPSTLQSVLQQEVFNPLEITTARFVKPLNHSQIEKSMLSVPPSTFAMEDAELELADSGLAMTLRDVWVFLSSINPYDAKSRKLLKPQTLQMALQRVFACGCINDVAYTPLDMFKLATDWSLLGPLAGNNLAISSVYGISSIVENFGNLLLVFKDQPTYFWDVPEVLSHQLFGGLGLSKQTWLLEEILKPVHGLPENPVHEKFIQMFTLLIKDVPPEVDRRGQRFWFTRLLRCVSSYVSMWEEANAHCEASGASPLAPSTHAPLIISGLPRTGSTLLYSLMACDPQTRAPKWWEMNTDVTPSSTGADDDPRIQEGHHLLHTLVADGAVGKFSRSHPTLAHQIDEEVYIMGHAGLNTFLCAQLLMEEYQSFAQSNQPDHAYLHLKNYIETLDKANPPESHWTLKSPYHAEYLGMITQYFPKARMVFTHRDVEKVVPSFAQLLVSEAGLYMADGYEDGIKARVATANLDWLKRCAENIMKFQDSVPDDSYVNVNYNDLISRPVATVERIYAQFGLEVTDGFRMGMEQFLSKDKQGKHGRATYSLAEFSYSSAQLSHEFEKYNKRFLSAPKTKVLNTVSSTCVFNFAASPEKKNESDGAENDSCPKLNLTGPEVAEVDLPDLSGSWTHTHDDVDALDELLKKEGVSWTLRRAMRLFTPKLVIIQTGNHLDIKFDTVAQSYDDSFEVGEDIKQYDPNERRLITFSTRWEHGEE